MESLDKMSWVVTPVNQEGSKSDLEDLKFETPILNQNESDQINNQDVVEFSEVYYIFGKYNAIKKLTENGRELEADERSRIDEDLNRLDGYLKNFIYNKVLIYKLFSIYPEYRGYLSDIRINFNDILHSIPFDDSNYSKLEQLLPRFPRRHGIRFLYYILALTAYDIDNDFDWIKNDLSLKQMRVNLNSKEFKKALNQYQDKLQRAIIDYNGSSKITYTESDGDRLNAIFYKYIKEQGNFHFLNSKYVQTKEIFDEIEDWFKNTKKTKKIRGKCFALLEFYNTDQLKLFVSGQIDLKHNLIDAFLKGHQLIEYIKTDDCKNDDFEPVIIFPNDDEEYKASDFELQNYILKAINGHDRDSETPLTKILSSSNLALYCTEKKIISYLKIQNNLDKEMEMYVRYNMCASCDLAVRHEADFSDTGEVWHIRGDSGLIKIFDNPNMEEDYRHKGMKMEDLKDLGLLVKLIGGYKP